MKVVVVTGSRDLPDDGYVESVLEGLAPNRVIVGDCPTGADCYAERWARANDVWIFPLAALWHNEGRSEGPRRNRRAARLAADLRDLGCEVVAVAFPMKGKPNRGTLNCVKALRDVEIRAFVHARGPSEA